MTRGNFEQGELRIELMEPDELFEPRRSHIMDGEFAVDSGIDRISSELGATSLRNPPRLAILLPPEHVNPLTESRIREALRHYCETGIRQVENELAAVHRDGWQTLLFGALLLAAGLALSEAVLNSGWPSALRNFFGDGLFLVAAWVGLWYPLDTLIYAGRPYRAERKVLRAIRALDVAVRPAAYQREAGLLEQPLEQ